MNIKQLFLGKYYFSIFTLILFLFLVKFSPNTLKDICGEDGVIENLSAAFFLIASIGFFITAKKSSYLKSKNNMFAYFMIISWALLMFIFFGEEISWGQRIFDFATPQSLEEVNLQQEFNIHNIGIVNSAFGGKYRYLTIMMLLTGFVFPLMALTTWGKKLFQKLNYPICPLHFIAFFLGGYLYGKYFFVFDVPTDTLSAVTEAREFIFSLGMMSFALHGAWKPNSLFLEKN